jgi:hypothetical protein
MGHETIGDEPKGQQEDGKCDECNGIDESDAE